LKAPIQQQIMFVTAEDDRVAMVTEGHALTVGGVTYNNMYHLLFQFDGDRIVHVWEFNDTAHSKQVFRRDADGTLDLTSLAAGDASGDAAPS
jgi:ketosteroid isomerase-like protein